MSTTQQTERVPLSLNQEFVVLFDSGGEDGPFGPHYHIVEAWRSGAEHAHFLVSSGFTLVFLYFAVSSFARARARARRRRAESRA